MCTVQKYMEERRINFLPFFLQRRGEKSPGRRMDRLRRSFRDSFRRRKEPHTPEASKPHIWYSDENAVRSATCAFQVKVSMHFSYFLFIPKNSIKK